MMSTPKPACAASEPRSSPPSSSTPATASSPSSPSSAAPSAKTASTRARSCAAPSCTTPPSSSSPTTIPPASRRAEPPRPRHHRTPRGCPHHGGHARARPLGRRRDRLVRRARMALTVAGHVSLHGRSPPPWPNAPRRCAGATSPTAAGRAATGSPAVSTRRQGTVPVRAPLPPGPPGKWTDAATGDLLDLIGHRIGAGSLGPALDEGRAFPVLSAPERRDPEAARILGRCRRGPVPVAKLPPPRHHPRRRLPSRPFLGAGP